MRDRLNPIGKLALKGLALLFLLLTTCSKTDDRYGPVVHEADQPEAEYLSKEALHERVRALDSAAVMLTEQSLFIQSALLLNEAEDLLLESLVMDCEDSLLLGNILSDHARNLLYAQGRSTPNAEKLATIERAIAIHRDLSNHKEERISRRALLHLAIDYDILEGYQTHHIKEPTPTIPLEALRIKRDVLGMKGAEVGRSLMNVGNDYWFRNGTPRAGLRDVDSARFYFRQAVVELESDWLRNPWKYAEFLSGAHLNLARMAVDLKDPTSLEYHLEHGFGCMLHKGATPLVANALDGIEDEQEVLRDGVGFARLVEELRKLTGRAELQTFHDKFMDLYSRVTQDRLIRGEGFGESGLWHLDWVVRYQGRSLINTGLSGGRKDTERLLVLLDRLVNARLNKQRKLAALMRQQVTRPLLDSVWYWRTVLQHTSPGDVDGQSRSAFERALRGMDQIERMLAQYVDSLTLTDTATTWASQYGNDLKDDEALVIVHPQLASLLIDKNGLRVIPLPDDGSPSQQMDDLAHSLSMGGEVSARNAWRSYELYRLLFPKGIDASTQKLGVAAMGTADRFPFEALVTTPPDTTVDTWQENLQFLGDRVVVRYGFSPRELVRSAEWIGRHTRTLVFAPSYPKDGSVVNARSLAMRTAKPVADLRDVLVPIKNEEEAQKIMDHVHAEGVVGDEATEARFKREALMSMILHVAAHGLGDENDPSLSGLVFSDAFVERNDQDGEDGILHAFEIYGMELQCELVGLSACETGTGLILEGEGSLSLARAFRSAGARNVLMSLWKVEDRSTVEIMDAFYAHLATGQGKAEALSNAKRDFRRAHPHAPPALWAAFVLLGDNEPLNFQRSISIYLKLLGVVCFALGLAFVIQWRKRRQQTSQRRAVG
jgi:hypothetical protein